MQQDTTDALAAQVQQAFAEKKSLRIVGGNSKSLLGRAVAGELLDVSKHTGIVDYQPTELVITARAGTPLKVVESALAERGQRLPFEPPYLGESATLGGTIACGLSGPSRPFAGSARDFVLGARMINGRGEVLGFGGQVMKNVAGYDVSRLQVGAQGTLGVLLDVSLKVLPSPVFDRTVVIEMDAARAIETMAQLINAALPLSAACHLPKSAQQPAQLILRLSAVEAAVLAALEKIQTMLAAFSVQEKDNNEAQVFWQDLRERRLPFFAEVHSLWRLSVPPATPALTETLAGDCLMDWAGAHRWLKTTASVSDVQIAAKKMAGHATLVTETGVMLAPLSPAVEKIHRQVKTAFDPAGILNPGRLYEGW